MGTFHKEKIKESQLRARARRKNELLDVGLLSAPPVKRSKPSARMRCSDNSEVALGEQIWVRRAQSFGAATSKAGKAVGFVETLPASVMRSVAEDQMVEATVCRKHAFGTGFDIQFELPTKQK